MLADLIPKYYFKPPPKVDSRIIILKLKNEEKIYEETFEKFIHLLFASKNKKMRNALNLLYKKNMISPYNTLDKYNHYLLDKKVRQFTVDELMNLYKTLSRNT